MDEVEITSEMVEQAGLKKTTVKRDRPRASHWTVTVHADYLADKVTLDPNGTPLEQKEAWFNRADQFKYAVFGREICPTTGKKHLQGYVNTRSPKDLSVLKKLFPKAHLEICGGNPDQNRRYCIKDGDYVEYGECPIGRSGVGKQRAAEMKAEYAEAKQLAKEGKLDDISPGKLLIN